jgi:hypothetical protein
VHEPQTTQPELWLIGGYGEVGLRTAARLTKLPGLMVLLAGRDAARAAAASQGGDVCGVGLARWSPNAQKRISRAASVANFFEASPPDLSAAIAVAGAYSLRLRRMRSIWARSPMEWRTECTEMKLGQLPRRFAFAPEGRCVPAIGCGFGPGLSCTANRGSPYMVGPRRPIWTHLLRGNRQRCARCRFLYVDRS